MGQLLKVTRAALRLGIGVLLGVLRAVVRGGRSSSRRGSRARGREVLVSLYDRHPQASAAAQRPRGLQAVPLEQIAGTTRHPSQNTADFQPLRQLRGRNWEARWARISGATERLEMLPPVELVKVGDEYYVADGHNRVAAALAADAVAIDADVTELVLPGAAAGTPSASMSSSMVGAEELRQAGTGRLSRTAERRPVADVVSRRDLLRASGENPRAPGEETDVHPVVPADAPDEAPDHEPSGG